MIEAARVKRVGLLATTAIRQAGARHVLQTIGETAEIFFAVSDRDWILDGAAVRISMVGFGKLLETEKPVFDGSPVVKINSDLTAGVDATKKHTLRANLGLCFMGTKKVGAFDVDTPTAVGFLRSPNPDLRPNSDVVRPYRNGSDLVRKPSNRWIVDFGTDRGMSDAALYDKPFAYVVECIKPTREKNARKSRAEKWWLLGETLPAFRRAVKGLARYIATPCVSKFRVFVWLDTSVIPDGKLIMVAWDDDYHFGILHSRLHEAWTLATCGWHGKGNDPNYNPTICFETFPFPKPTDAQGEAIAMAAKRLDELRNNWLNPPEWTRTETLEFPGSADGPWKRYIDPATVDDRGIGTVRYPRLVPRDAECAKELKKRTLTNLYNERPTWLDLAHRKLDEAVFAAYGWEPSLSDEDLLAALLALNLERSAMTR